MLSFKQLRLKKVAVVGLAVESLSTLRFLSQQGYAVTVLDQKNRKELGKNYLAAKRLGAKFQLGKNYLKMLDKFDLVFRSPGVPRTLPALGRAEKRGVEISSHTILFFDLCPCPIIGVTGTKGKGTTSSLIAELLRAGGRRVFLGGNIGQPPLDFLLRLKPTDWVVLELSSFQLQDLKRSPSIAVVLNVTADHLDVHRDLREYRAAKEAISRYQRPTDWVIANGDYRSSQHLAELSPAKKFWVGVKKKPSRKPRGYQEKNKLWLEVPGKKVLAADVAKLKLRGRHNWENILPAAAAAYLVGIGGRTIRKTAEAFRGLEHRLELVGSKRGITFYNDSFSTGPQPTIAALRSFNKPLVLIAGGYDKGLNYQELAREIKKQTVKAVILLGKVGAKIKKRLTGYSGELLEGSKTMGQIFKQIRSVAKKRDVVLLSPGAASFDMFQNYKDRGQQFKQWVKKF